MSRSNRSLDGVALHFVNMTCDFVPCRRLGLQLQFQDYLSSPAVSKMTLRAPHLAQAQRNNC